MKRILFILSSALVLCQAYAVRTMEYGFSDSRIFGLGAGTAAMDYNAAIEVPEDVAASMKGGRLTAISLGFGSAAYTKDITLYLSYELGGEPFYTQEERVSSNRLQTFGLETPYEIEGRRFFVGYTYYALSPVGSPIAFTNDPSSANACFDNLGVSAGGRETEWDHFGSRYGNLNLSFKVECDEDLSVTAAVPSGLALPEYSPVGEKFDAGFSFRNFGTETIGSVGLVYTVGSGAAQTMDVSLPAPVAPGETGTVTFSASSAESMYGLPVEVAIVSVNGLPNVWKDTPARATLINSDDVFARKVVIEEFTGVTCGFCPAGWIGLKTLYENHPEDVINIAVHNYNNGHELACASYAGWVSRYVTTAPQATANRMGYAFSPSPVSCERMYEQVKGMSPASVDIAAGYADGTFTRLATDVTVRFGESVADIDYGIAWVLTEDNLGPYDQHNNYAGGHNGNMYGFENEPSLVPLMYDHVARDIFHWDGLAGSVPSSVEKDRDYVCSLEVPIAAPDNEHGHVGYNVIALLVDRVSGEIVNAATTRIRDAVEPGQVGVAPVGVAAAPAVRVVDGCIRVSGEGAFDVNVYDAAGVAVAAFRGAGEVKVAPGMYVVLAGGSVTKLIVP